MATSVGGEEKRLAARRGRAGSPAAGPGVATPVGLAAILAAASLLAIGSWRAEATDCPDQTQIGLDQCADRAFQKADRALNEAYREILRRFGDEAHAKQLLVVAQKAWIAFRDAECAFAVSGSEGGSIYPMEYSLCLEDQTKKRTKELQAYFHCSDGDLACPVNGN